MRSTYASTSSRQVTFPERRASRVSAIEVSVTSNLDLFPSAVCARIPGIDKAAARRKYALFKIVLLFMRPFGSIVNPGTGERIYHECAVIQPGLKPANVETTPERSAAPDFGL